MLTGEDYRGEREEEALGEFVELNYEQPNDEHCSYSSIVRQERTEREREEEGRKMSSLFSENRQLR